MYTQVELIDKLTQLKAKPKGVSFFQKVMIDRIIHGLKVRDMNRQELEQLSKTYDNLIKEWRKNGGDK